MGAWDLYQAQVEARGNTKRGAQLQREQHYLLTKLPDHLSYHHVKIDDVEQDVAIINTDNLDTKFIYSLPGEDVRHGGLVEWMDNHWLITERDYNTEVYTRAKMLQCNYLLKWVDDDNVIHEQWCIVEDGTKYLTGEYEDKQFIVTRGDSRIAITLAKNEYTVKLTRDYRFIVDDPDSSRKIAYQLTKPLKLGMSFGNDGVYKFVLQEVATTDYDNTEEGIADYYRHFPRPVDDTIDPDENKTETGKKVWL